MVIGQGCLLKEGNACFSLRRLRVDIVNDVITFAIKDRPFPNASNIYPRQSLPRPLSLPVFLSQ